MKNTVKINFILGCLTGLVIFVMLFGFKPVNPVNIDWIDSANIDIYWYQSGWEFFRNEKWHIIPGLITSATYPFATSILNLDIIPLVAIPLKLISALLPEKFQYFGLWLLMCFILQGGFAAIIFGKYIKNTAVIIIGTIIIVCMPAFILRTFIHASFCAYFLILAGLALYVYKENLKNKTAIILWSILLCCSVAIHIYITLMVYVIMLSFCLYDYLKNRNFVLSLKLFAATAFSMIITGFILGEHYIIPVMRDLIAKKPIELNAANLNSFINPYDDNMSFFLYPRPQVMNDTAYNTLYLGFGVILLCAVLFFAALIVFENKKSRLDLLVKLEQPFYVSLGIGVILLALFAVYPRIAFDNNVLYEMRLPYILEYVMKTFREYNRMLLPFMYCFIFATIIILSGFFKNNKKYIIFLSVILFIQILDLYPMLKNKSQNWENGGFFSWDTISENKFKSDKWNEIGAKYKHLYLVDDLYSDFNIFKVAIKNNMTFNKIYTARSLDEYYMNENSKIFKQMSENRIPEDTVFVIFGNKEYFSAEFDSKYIKDEILKSNNIINDKLLKLTGSDKKNLHNTGYDKIFTAFNIIIRDNNLYNMLDDNIKNKLNIKSIFNKDYPDIKKHEEVVRLNKIILKMLYPDTLKHSFTAVNTDIPKMQNNEQKKFNVVSIDGCILILP